MEWSTHTHALLSRKLTRSKLSIQQLHEQRDQLRMHVRDTENRHDALLQNRDKARQALERSKQAANRPRQDLHTSELNALASSIALEKNTLEDARRDLTDINQKLVKAMDDHAGLELEVSKAGLSDAITQRKSTLATKAEERRARETGIQETATRALATRSLETVGSGVEHLAVSAPGTKPADLIAQATKEKRQAGLAREAEEMQAAEDKKVRDVLDFQSNMDEQKKILAEQTRLRAQRRKREEQHEDLERTELAKQGINVLSETCRAKNKLEREANEKKFALEQEHKKMELSRTLEQQRAVLQQRSATASKPQWHDRADIKSQCTLTC
ncbi:uncharacterized protein LOC135817029 [Sycon ciliatum]|uniref:uncharacterized protein LOC135817029 n=1 Tax=Sycon ciliatum TaxID=27933 RepID=UPI0031F63F8D